MRKRTGTRFDGRLGALVGSTFVTRLNDHADRAPLRIGSQVWSTHQLASQLGVVHTKAARLLTAAAAVIGAKNVRDLYARSSPRSLAPLGGLGETTLYVLWRLFESQGLDPERWAGGDSDDDAVLSFHTLKNQARAAEAAAPRRRRA